MKREYLSLCKTCNGHGHISSRSLTSTTEICPVCCGSKVQIITETIEEQFQYAAYNLSTPLIVQTKS